MKAGKGGGGEDNHKRNVKRSYNAKPANPEHRSLPTRFQHGDAEHSQAASDGGGGMKFSAIHDIPRLFARDRLYKPIVET